MNAHTPGPWTLKLGKYGSPHVIEWAPGKTYGQIAQVNTPSFQELPEAKTADEVATNARLLAAAPDLLSALREMLDAFSLENVGVDAMGKNLAAKRQARDAIAKAEGGE